MMNRKNDLGKLEVLLTREEGEFIIKLLQELNDKRSVNIASYEKSYETLLERLKEAVAMTDPCSRCRGTGRVDVEYNGMFHSDACPDCVYSPLGFGREKYYD